VLLASVAAVSLGAGAEVPEGAEIERDSRFGLRYTRYTVTDLGGLGGTISEAWGINNAGQVVGRAYLAGDVWFHAFVWEAGVMTDLGTIGQGCNPGHSWAYDINDAGQIVGQTCASGISARAFRRTGGVMTDLGTLGGTGSGAFGINSAGHVVGAAAVPGDPFNHAFLYDGAMHDLGSLGGAWSAATHISDHDTIVGWSEIRPLPDRKPHAFVYSAPTMTDIFPGAGAACCSYAWGINNADTVVGEAYDRGFVFSRGVVTDLPTLAGSKTSAYAINDADEIVGYSVTAAGAHAFLYRDGRIIDLNDHIPDDPGWVLNYATAINDVGQIAGIGTTGGRTRAFLLNPVPTAPTAVDDAFVTSFEVALTIAAPGVLANDYGSGNSSMIAGLYSTVAHGTLVLSPDGGFVYTPAAGYAGTDSFSYRAINITGVSNVATVTLTVTQPGNAQPPTDLYAYSIIGNIVTLRWNPPVSGPRPTGYTVEGGVSPGEVLAVIPTGSAYPIYTFTAPTGSFYVRVHSLAGADKSAASREIRLHVRVPIPPSAPASLTSMVDGSAVNLAWRNTFAGGAAETVYLEAVPTGGAPMFFPLGVSDTFGAANVPAGSYALRLWAVNGGGVSPPSNQIVVSVPGACSGSPGMPWGFLAYTVGRTIFVIWDPATTGPAATQYVLTVGGGFVGSFSTMGRALSGTVSPGSYHLSVVAQNACGSSPATPVQTVSVP
jgi:probable HAF family extracellular repeat protein